MSLNDEQPHTRLRMPDDVSAPQGPRRPRWLGFLSVVAVIGLVVGALAFVEHSGGHPSASPSTPPRATTAAPSGALPHMSVPPPPSAAPTVPVSRLALPSSTSGAVPVGYPHTKAGAESAAVNYAVAYGSAPMSRPASRHSLVATIAAPSVAATLQSQLDSAYKQLNAALGLSAQGVPPAGQQLVMRMLPVGASVVSASAGSAVVSVWADSLSGLAGNGSAHPVAEQWETLRITVGWADGDWKWVGFSSTPGPTPVNSDQAPSSSQALQNAVEQFGGLSYAP